jgi:PAS domain S-box-containing protein
MSAERKDESSSHLVGWTVHPTSSRASSEDAPLATVFTGGRAHRVRHANGSFCLLTGLPRAEIVDRPLESIFHACDRRDLGALLDGVFATGMPNVVSNVPWRDTTRGEAQRYFTAIASPVLNEHSGERGLLVQVLDTTEQVVARAAEERAATEARLANEALVFAGLRELEMAEAARRENARWNALVDNLAEGVTVLDASGRPILVNPVGRTILGLEGPAEGYLRCTFHTVAGAALAPERHPAVRAQAGESFIDDELVHRGSDGSQRRLLFSGSSVRDDEGRVVLAINVYRDVTALRLLEETREEYVALISHDLRNPLSALLMNARLLIERLGADTEEERLPEHRYARSIERVTGRLVGMVEELYQSSALEAADLDVRLEPVSPASLLASLPERFGTREDRLRIVVDDANTLPLVRVDVPRFERALVNLVTNALKYSDPATKVDVELSRSENEVIFAVRDSGSGIAADDLVHLFEKYHRARGTRDREGMGLGLYIARRIVEAHRGRIWVESEVGHGSTFRIALPIVPHVSGA